MVGNYKPSKAGFKALMMEPSISAKCVAQATKGMVKVESIAPVKSGRYRSGFQVRPAMVRVGNDTRAGAVLVNTADYAVYVEAHLQILHRVIDTIERG